MPCSLRLQNLLRMWHERDAGGKRVVGIELGNRWDGCCAWDRNRKGKVWELCYNEHVCGWIPVLFEYQQIDRSYSLTLEPRPYYKHHIYSTKFSSLKQHLFISKSL
jgi:hypothetical protein